MDRITLGDGERLKEEERSSGKPTEAWVKGQKYQMNLSRIMRLSRVAALICVSMSASVRLSWRPWAPQFSFIYSQSSQISPMVDDEDRNRPMLTRRTNGAGLGPAGASFDPFDSNHPSFKKKCVWRGKRGKQRRNEGETTEGDTEAGPLWKQRVEKTTKTPLLLTN